MLADAAFTWDLAADIRELLRFDFMQNAYAAGTIVAVLCGFVGYFVVLRGESFATHTLSQVGFPGAAGAALLGLPVLAGLIAFCLAAALAIAAFGSRAGAARRSENAAIGSILVFSLALGLLFARLYHGFVHATYASLFGTFLGISDAQVWTLAAIAALSLACLAAMARPLLFASLEPDVAAARGVAVRGLSVAFFALVALAVASTALITGTLLVFALVVTPAATARELSARPMVTAGLSVLIAIAVTWAGLAMAYYSVYPLGSFVTTLSFAAYVSARAYRRMPALALRGGPARPAGAGA
jgi:zinc/manganese transport system permease protein